MMHKMTTRREVLRRALQVPLAGAALGVFVAACDGQGGVCYDAASAPDKEQREKFRYVEASPDPAKTCGNCAFFSGELDSCGTCPVFNGGSVSHAGHCDSWAART